MPRVKLGGRVVESDLKTPVSGARIRIYDLDTGGDGHDLIFDRTTDAKGEFSGLSKDWVDLNKLGWMEIPDAFLLQFRVDLNGRTHQGSYFHIGDYKSAPVIMPPRPLLARANREMIHMVTLTTDHMDAMNRSLYEVVGWGALAGSATTLGSEYRNFRMLKDEHATLEKLCQQLENAASDSTVKAVDLILSPHGSNDRVYFHDKDRSMAEVRDKLKTIPETRRRKFRIVFSTACFGASHMDEWIDAGFEAVSGSRKIYADSLLSFPAFLSAWRLGKTFAQAVDAANASDPLRLQDQAASSWFLQQRRRSEANDVDSFRLRVGNTQLTISTAP